MSMLENLVNFGRRISASAALLGVLAFSTACDENTNTGQGQQAASPAPRAAEPQRETRQNALSVNEKTRYFPLAVGNTWTYERKVFPGKQPLNKFKYRIVEDLEGRDRENTGMLMFGIEPMIQTGTETFTITNQEENRFFFKSETKSTNSEVQGLEPYLLMDIKSAYWRRNIWSGGKVVLFELREGEHFGANVKSDEFIASLNTDCGFQIDTSASNPENYHKKVMGVRGETITVPAGTFRDTIKNTFEYIGGNKPEKVTMVRHFAKDVGLVREEQRNSNNEITYTLELLSFKQ